MDKKHILDECLEAIMKTFHEAENKYEAHLKCYPILHRMAAEDEVIFEIFRRNILNERVFSKGSCTPDFQLTLIDAPECFLFVNFFGPNKDSRTDISYSTMHHHDDYLLSTINAKGNGYTSLIFEQGYEIDKESMTAKVELEKYVLHAPGHIEFIDCHTAHTIFYPESTTMTYGLWSTHFPTSSVTKARENRFIQKNKELIKGALNLFNLNPKAVGVQQYREDYFYPKDGSLIFLEKQIEAVGGDHFVQNFFNILMDFLSFDDINFLKEKYSKVGKDEKLKIFLEKSIENEIVSRNYDGYEQFIPKRNVHIDEYRKCYNF